MAGKNGQVGIVKHIIVTSLVGMLVFGLITWAIQHSMANDSVRRRTEEFSMDIADEVVNTVKIYPAYKWLFNYWYTHWDTMDIEYDVDYTTGTRTREKAELLSRHNPGIQILYVTDEEAQALSEEDQKLFAEVTYSWLIYDLNLIKRNFDIDYLFGVITETDEENDAYKDQFFLFSATDPGDIRGTEYEQVYTLGVMVSVAENESQQQSMRQAVEEEVNRKFSQTVYNFQGSRLAAAGDYVDYYIFIDMMGDKAVLLGMTFSLEKMKAEIAKQAMTYTVLCVILEALLIARVIFHLLIFLLRPLKDIQKSIRLYRDNKDSKAVIESLNKILKGHTSMIIRRNEIGTLARDVISLAKEMDEHTKRIQNITAEKERIETELSLASEIQEAMLPTEFPPFPDRHEFDLFAVMNPAKEVGGDFYDFFLIDDDHLGLTIADVSGKGIPAALVMMISKIVLQNCAKQGNSPAMVLEQTNRILAAENRMGMFVTMWFGILEISTGILTASNAGHEYPFIRRNGHYEMFNDKHGVVVGVMEDAKYTEYNVQLKKGDSLFVYTDGVAEANNREQQLFGLDRIKEALNKNPSADCREQIQNVTKAVEDFSDGAAQFDDLTILCLEYNGPASDSKKD